MDLPRSLVGVKVGSMVLHEHRALLRYSSAVASGNVELLQLTPSAFRVLTRERPERYADFARLLGRHHRLAIDYIASLRSLPTCARIAQVLVFLSRRSVDNESPDDSVCLSQEDWAAVVGASRQTINGELKALQRRGLIERRYAKIYLRDRPALERLSRGSGHRVSSKVDRRRVAY